jgi:RNA polymerase sigma factor (sigma-70 family)
MTALPDWNIVSDAELVGAAAAGDRGAFAGIYDRYAGRLHDFCIGMVRDRDAAADCVQDVFCTAAVDLPKLRDPDKLRPWLYAIARHTALRTIRDRRRESASDELPDEASGDASPDTLAARNELANLIAEAAGGLTDRDREVLELAYRHGLNGPDLADALGVGNESAKKLVQRLRDTIERSLGALLVARRARTAESGCPELAAILQGWDGKFTILMRKRIARHIESCPSCDEERGRLVNPVALLGGVPVFIPAPSWLRDRTLSQIHLTSASVSDAAGPSDQTAPMRSDSAPTQARDALPDDVTAQLETTPAEPGETELAAVNHDGAGRRFLTRRMALFVALFVGVPLAAVVIGIAWLELRTAPVVPIGVTGPVPPAGSTTPTAAPVTVSSTLNNPPPQSITTTPTTLPVVPATPANPPTSAPVPPPFSAPAPPPPNPPAPPSLEECPDGSFVPFGHRCPPPPRTPCPDGSSVPADQACPTPTPPPRTPCPDGSSVPADQACPTPTPPPRTPCPDGSSVPADQTCPTPPSPPPPPRWQPPINRPPISVPPSAITSPPAPPPVIR